jgi:hypothetical protein
MHKRADRAAPPEADALFLRSETYFKARLFAVPLRVNPVSYCFPPASRMPPFGLDASAFVLTQSGLSGSAQARALATFAGEMTI